MCDLFKDSSENQSGVRLHAEEKDRSTVVSLATGHRFERVTVIDISVQSDAQGRTILTPCEDEQRECLSNKRDEVLVLRLNSSLCAPVIAVLPVPFNSSRKCLRKRVNAWRNEKYNAGHRLFTLLPYYFHSLNSLLSIHVYEVNLKCVKKYKVHRIHKII